MSKLYVIGLGPGGVEQMTKRAYDALKPVMLLLAIMFT